MITHTELHTHLMGLGFKITSKRQSINESPINCYRTNDQDIEAPVALFTAKNPQRGAFVKWFEVAGGCPLQCGTLEPHVHGKVWLRTENGGYKMSSGQSVYFAQALVRDYSVVDKVGFTGSTKDVVIPRLGFGPTHRGSKCTILNACISQCNIVNVVTVGEDRFLSKDIFDKGAKLWFHFSCAGGLGATFDIVSDGTEWIPVDRRKARLSKNLCPKTSVDLRCMSVVDQATIVQEIQRYLGNI